MTVQPTIVSYAGDGTTTNFTFQFDYLNSDYVVARVNGADASFTFTGEKAISLAEAPAEGSVLVISRETDRERLVTFTDGSVLVEEDLNLADLQLLHIVQEAVDLAGTSLGLTDDGSLSAAGRRISSVGDPENDQDVVTRIWAETSMSSQLVQASALVDEATAQAVIAADEAAEALRQRTLSAERAADAADEAAEALNQRTLAAARAADASYAADSATASAIAAADEAEEALRQRTLAAERAADAETYRDETAVLAVQAAASQLRSTGVAAIAGGSGRISNNDPVDSVRFGEIRLPAGDYLIEWPVTVHLDPNFTGGNPALPNYGLTSTPRARGAISMSIVDVAGNALSTSGLGNFYQDNEHDYSFSIEMPGTQLVRENGLMAASVSLTTETVVSIRIVGVVSQADDDDRYIDYDLLGHPRITRLVDMTN